MLLQSLSAVVFEKRCVLLQFGGIVVCYAFVTFLLGEGLSYVSFEKSCFNGTGQINCYKVINLLGREMRRTR